MRHWSITKGIKYRWIWLLGREVELTILFAFSLHPVEGGGGMDALNTQS
jgi:hypothetical protein